MWSRSFPHVSYFSSPAWLSFVVLRGSKCSRGTQLVQGSAVYRLVMGQSSNLFLSFRGESSSGGCQQGVQECYRSCQLEDTTRKVCSPSVLMSPTHKQIHCLCCLDRLIRKYIKHTVAGTGTNGMLSFYPRWCYYVLSSLPLLIGSNYSIQMDVNLTQLKSL